MGQSDIVAIDSCKRALVVEHDPRLAYILETGLTNSGMIVELVKDGDKGLVALQQSEHDLVVVNLRLDRVSGLDFLSLLRYLIDPKSVKIVVIDDSDTEQVPLTALNVDLALKAKDVPAKLPEIAALGGDRAS